MTHEPREKIQTTQYLNVYPTDINVMSRLMTDTQVISFLREFQSKFSTTEYNELVPEFIHQCRPIIVQHLFDNGAQLLDEHRRFYQRKFHTTLDLNWYTSIIPVLAPQVQKEVSDGELKTISARLITKINCRSMSDAHTALLVRAYVNCVERPNPICPKVIAALAEKGITFTTKADAETLRIEALKKELAQIHNAENEALKTELAQVKGIIAELTNVINTK